MVVDGRFGKVRLGYFFNKTIGPGMGGRSYGRFLLSPLGVNFDPLGVNFDP
jgi:hypothetical protein